MNTQQKLIILYSFAAVGKTTIGRKYIAEHPLSLCIEGDEIIAMIGQWLQYEDQAREYVFELLKSMTNTYLKTGKTVIIPYLPTNANHLDAFEQIAKKYDIPFFEIFFTTGKEDAIQRLFERGTWGEPGSPPITKNDLPTMHHLYDTMMQQLENRSNLIRIPSISGEIENTYLQFLEAINENQPNQQRKG